MPTLSQRDVEAMAAEVVLLVKSALAPVLERLAVAETRLAEADKYAARLEGSTSLLQSVTAELSQRVAVVETRPLLPGPAGKDGEPGPPGADGKAGLTYQGVYQDGKSYELGDVATWGGSTWHCNEPTTTRPGENTKAWTLMVKRGRDGKDK